jgi:WhiB family transcriptional regulator, redox-sensing transcriptional regulator
MNLPEPAAPAGADWRSLSACRDADPELFFPLSAWGPGQAQTASAKAVCASCQVRSDCLQFALRSGQEFGVWGGTSEDERRALRRAQLVRTPRPVAESAQRSKRRRAAQPVRLSRPVRPAMASLASSTSRSGSGLPLRVRPAAAVRSAAATSPGLAGSLP